MPYDASDASSYTRKAKSPKKKRQFSHVANDALARGASEGSAIRQANAVVARSGRKNMRKRRKSRRY